MSSRLVEVVRSAYKNSEPLRIMGSGSKFFLGRPIIGTLLDVSANEGILTYEPSELTLTARAGTKLENINSTLQSNGQMLGFEPPLFGGNATIGGVIACGLSGPRRPFEGAARDFTLGVKIINGKGDLLQFGGEVIKNVAGYDVSRLMVGAYGSLGVILEVSMKVLPLNEVEKTLVQETSEQEALERMNTWTKQALSISALSFFGGVLRIRLSGTENGTKYAQSIIGGEVDADGHDYWYQLKEQKLEFFQRTDTLWRISLPMSTASVDFGGTCLIDWGGALRWVYSPWDHQKVFDQVKQLHGHATVFRSKSNRLSTRFTSLSKPVAKIHQQLKLAFDPKQILNPGIMYSDL